MPLEQFLGFVFPQQSTLSPTDSLMQNLKNVVRKHFGYDLTKTSTQTYVPKSAIMDILFLLGTRAIKVALVLLLMILLLWNSKEKLHQIFLNVVPTILIES